MSILDKIISRKYIEVKEQKLLKPVSVLDKSPYFSEKPISLKNAISREGSSRIIAEFKRRSPSKGVFKESASASNICAGYAGAGAAAISVLTNREFFGASADDLSEVRKSADCPVLCKDFIIDEYQVIEARAYGADCVLLISDIHTAGRLRNLYRLVISLGMEALIEVHNKESLTRIPEDAEIVGINSRNLASFNVSLDHSLEMVKLLPGKIIRVAESGIASVNDYYDLKNAGFNAFLIGEYFMRSDDPAQTCREFIETKGKWEK